MTLREYLDQHDIKPTAFAGRIGVRVSTITRIIRGERLPSLEIFDRIHTATGGAVTSGDFLRPTMPQPAAPAHSKLTEALPS